MGEPSPVCSSRLVHSPQGGEWNLHSRDQARTTVGGARPSAHTAHRRAASRPQAACGHTSYQEVLCRGGSFPCIPTGLSGLGVRAAGRYGLLLADIYHGPFRVLERGQKSIKLQMGEHVDQVSRDRLKPHRAVKNLELQVKRPRSRPPRDGD